MEASSSSLRDHFLLAMPALDSGIFAGSITYICEHGEAGAMGLVINQPLDLGLHEILDHLDITDPMVPDREVLAGGPVQIDHGFILHRDDERRWDSTLRVTDSIHLTTSQDILKALAIGEGPNDYLVALGYAGWAAGQLEEEIVGNSWLTLPADHEIIFRTDCDQRVARAASALGIDMNLLTAEAGHA